MDFSLTETQKALRALARQILASHCRHERLKEVEASPDRFDRQLWGELARAGLLGVALPEDVGGGGGGLIELAVLFEEAGRAVARVPLWAAVAAAAIDRFGSPVLRRRHLPAYTAGREIPTFAWAEPGCDDPLQASTELRGGRLYGTKTCVPAGPLASVVVVPARDGLYLAAPGLPMERQELTNLEICGHLVLDGTPAERLGGPEAVAWVAERATALACVMQAGVCARALEMTASYTSTREQFGRKLAAFQAVAQRAADAFIDTEAVRLTAWQAVWRLEAGLDARREVAVAKFWAAEAGQRVVHAAQHLHGGIGVDVDYPLHRYFLWAKQLELMLGGATPQLLRLGELIAEGR